MLLGGRRGSEIPLCQPIHANLTVEIICRRFSRKRKWEEMFPGATAAATPDKPAVVMASTGQVVTHRELDDRSNQLARLWREHGLVPGDHVAVFMENHPRYLEVVWAALRSGLYVTTVNSYLSAAELAYILSDSGARSVVASPARAEVLREALNDAPGVELPLVTDGGAGPMATTRKHWQHSPLPRSMTNPPGSSCSTAPAPRGARKGSSDPSGERRSRTVR